MKQQQQIQYSLRAMLGTIMLLSVLLGTWNACKQRAVSDVKTLSGGWIPEVIAPYLLCIEKSDNVDVVATYHVWCFGLICDLPYSRQFPETGGFVSGGVRPRYFVHEVPSSDLVAELRKYKSNKSSENAPPFAIDNSDETNKDLTARPVRIEPGSE